MKTVLLAIALVISILLQLFFLQSWQADGISANVVLAYLAIISIYTTTEQMLWMSLFAGLSSDMYSSGDFGFYLGFYLLVAVACKYLFKFGSQEHSWWKPIFFLAFAASAQSLVVSLPLYSSSAAWEVTQQALTFVILTVGVGVLWYLLLSQLLEMANRIKLPGILNIK